MNGSSREVIYELARTETLSGWWLWALLVLCLAIVIVGAVRLYRRDAGELARGVRWTLITLRLAAVFGLVFFFLDAQRRTQQSITRPSEVAVLVDTSQSMSLPASEQFDSESRSVVAATLIKENKLLDQLSSEHRVSIYSFGETADPILLETRGGQLDAEEESAAKQDRNISPIALGGLMLVAIAGLLSIASLVIGASGNAHRIPWILFATAATMIIGIITTGVVYSIRSDEPLLQIIGVQPANSSPREDDEEKPDETESKPVVRVDDWAKAVSPTAAQSRIGDAIRSVLSDHDPTTLAGIILLTDGQSNGGTDTGSAVAIARRNEVSLYPIGLGSVAAPTNIRVVDLDAPRRVYPNDKFAISAILQGNGKSDMEIEVQLLDGLDNSGEGGVDQQDTMPTEVVDSKKVKVSGDGKLTPIRFEIEPESVGRRRLAVRVVPPAADRNKLDDVRDARYEVVTRQLKVMAVAGGPTREYRFVRNLLFRDKSIELHTWLQTGQEGMSQDADELLKEFPQTPEALFDYDAIVMFDPDWTQLKSESLDLLDRWVAEQAGGMLIVGGPVYHPRWLKLRTDPRVPTIKGFFPVTFPSRGPLIGSGRQGGDNAWPLEFTTDARRAEFLWLVDKPKESFEIWDEFDGVFDYLGVSGAKPGAKVYAYFSDPTTSISDSLPVYLASQFYGAGRVFFQSSGEMWRLRRTSDAHFDSYYTKLVRWICEGRLLRDSTRGVLLVDNPRAMVGDTITVRAVLTDEQFEPLTVPEVPAKLLAPSGRIEDVRLLPLTSEPRPGTYGGRFLVREAGSYELRLTVGDALSEEVLRQTVQVSLPEEELERPKRNDPELKQFASTTSGQFFPLDDISNASKLVNQVTQTIRPQPQTTVLPGTPDVDFTTRRNAVLMWLIASVLAMEWITRRLHRLA